MKYAIIFRGRNTGFHSLQTVTLSPFDPAYHICLNRAGRNSPAVPVLAGPVFLKVKMKVHFYKW